MVSSSIAPGARSGNPKWLSMVQSSPLKTIHPDPSKIQALQDLPTPDFPVKLQSFLGLINYLQPFIPGIANRTTFLHIVQFAKWDWNPLTGAAFQNLKAWICHKLLNTTLTYHDHSKPVIVQTDASEYGLCTTHIQSGWPITFASNTLTDIKTHYTSIE